MPASPYKPAVKDPVVSFNHPIMYGGDNSCGKRSVRAGRVLARVERGSLRVRIALRPRIAGWDGGCTIHASMDPLYKKAIAQGVAGMAVFVAFIFLPAGTWHYWQGWLFIAVFSASTIGFTVYLARYDRPLLERRMNAGPQHEKEWSQKIIVSLIILTFFIFIILPPLDYRVGLSPVPAYLSFVGDIVIVLSFLFIFWVLKVNSLLQLTSVSRMTTK